MTGRAGYVINAIAQGKKAAEAIDRYLQHSIILTVPLHLDHVHICISIPPKYAVSNVVGDIKGKSAISIARNFTGRKRNFTGENFWARGYFVSTVGLDEEVVKKYIREQEKEDERSDQLKFEFEDPSPSGDS